MGDKAAAAAAAAAVAASMAAPAQSAAGESEIQAVLASRITQLENDAKEEAEDDRQMALAIRRATQEVQSIVESKLSAEEKIRQLQSKCLDTINESKRIDRTLTRTRRVTQREGDAVRNELTKMTTAKTRLESLCRELQKENVRVKEESRRMLQAEQQRRDELSAKFQAAITEIKGKLKEGDQCVRLEHEVAQLTEKLSSMREQYDIREKHFSVVIKSKELEHKLMEARLAQQTEIAQSEAAVAAALRMQIDELGRREMQLREQIEAHVAKFEQVQDIIAKSNGAFTSFKKELEQSGKKARRLETEKETLRQKNDTLNSKVIELVEERATLTKTIETLRGQKTKLENLCRALQTERKQARKLLEKYEGGTSPDGEPAPSDAADQGSAAADQSASAADSPAIAALDDEAA